MMMMMKKTTTSKARKNARKLTPQSPSQPRIMKCSLSVSSKEWTSGVAVTPTCNDKHGKLKMLQPLTTTYRVLAQNSTISIFDRQANTVIHKI